jgi:hypothetical protein
MPEDEGSHDAVPLLTKAEAIAVVRKWLDVDKVDPELIFASTGEATIRYKDLIFHLEQETLDGRLLLFAISRGRLIKQDRDREIQTLLRIASAPPSQPKKAEDS